MFELVYWLTLIVLVLSFTRYNIWLLFCCDCSIFVWWLFGFVCLLLIAAVSCGLGRVVWCGFGFVLGFLCLTARCCLNNLVLVLLLGGV